MIAHLYPQALGLGDSWFYTWMKNDAQYKKCAEQAKEFVPMCAPSPLATPRAHVTPAARCPAHARAARARFQRRSAISTPPQRPPSGGQSWGGARRAPISTITGRINGVGQCDQPLTNHYQMEWTAANAHYLLGYNEPDFGAKCRFCIHHSEAQECPPGFVLVVNHGFLR